MADFISGAGESLTKSSDADPYGRPDPSTASAEPSRARLARKWQQELAAARKWTQPFTTAARKCEKAYLDVRDTATGSASRVNLFWSNTQVLLAAIYGKLPEAEVKRKFNDFDDDVVKATVFQQAAVWEIWDRPSNSVCWYSEGCPFVLDYQQDLLGLEGFFPCPQPVVSTTLTRAFLPRSDYAMTQDIYRQLDALNDKLANLQRAIKAAGVFDKNAAALDELMKTEADNTLLPVENWSAFTEKGGLKGVCDWFPIEAFVNAITQLMQRKQVLESDLFTVLGISDLMRGTSRASETATAQKFKAQFGGARLGNLQDDVARFVSDVMRIRANIITTQFQPETMIKRSLIDRTPDAPLAQPAIAMLKDTGLAMHHVTVTADSLAAPDWETEKETRTEFMGAVSNYLMAAAPMVDKKPEAGAFLIKLLQWGAAGFKGSESIEGVLDQAARQMEQAAQAPPPPPPPPSPEDQKNLAAADKSKADSVKSQAEAERTTQETRLIKAQADAVTGAASPMGIPVPGAPFAPTRAAPFGATPGALPGGAPPAAPPGLPATPPPALPGA